MTIHDYLKHYIGIPYNFGGNNPLEGFDCSGLLCEGLRAFGLIQTFDYTAQGLYDLFKNRFKEMSPTPDCLLFFGKSKTLISHCAISINNYLMLEAGGGDSTTNSLKEASRRGAYVRVRPIKHRKDQVACLKILIPKEVVVA